MYSRYSCSSNHQQQRKKYQTSCVLKYVKETQFLNSGLRWTKGVNVDPIYSSFLVPGSTSSCTSNVAHNQQGWDHWVLQGYRITGPIPDLWEQNLHFNKTCKWSWRSLWFEKAVSELQKSRRLLHSFSGCSQARQIHSVTWIQLEMGSTYLQHYSLETRGMYHVPFCRDFWHFPTQIH